MTSLFQLWVPWLANFCARNKTLCYLLSNSEWHFGLFCKVMDRAIFQKGASTATQMICQGCWHGPYKSLSSIFCSSLTEWAASSDSQKSTLHYFPSHYLLPATTHTSVNFDTCKMDQEVFVNTDRSRRIIKKLLIKWWWENSQPFFPFCLQVSK